MTMTAERSETSLPLEQALQHAASSHKSVSGGEVVQLPRGIRNVAGEYHRPNEGGLFVHPVGSKAAYFTIKERRWRNVRDGKVRTADIMRVPGLENPHNGPSAPTLIASEIEGFIIDKHGEARSVADPKDPHPELFGDCVEVATKPTRSLYEAGCNVYDAYVKLWNRAEATPGGMFYPGSNLAHRTRTLDDMNKHPYVQRIGHELGRRRLNEKWAQDLTAPEVMILLDGASTQTHIERSHGLSSQAYAAMAHALSFSPLTLGLTAASPFANGEYFPRFRGPYAKIARHAGYMATRYFGRMLGSPEAGTPRMIIPEDHRILARAINRRMQSGAINNAGRVANQHGDIRLRVDLPPYGTTELSAKDSGGGYIEPMMAIKAAERAYMNIVETAHHKGDLNALQRKYPRIIKSVFTDKDREVAEKNNERIAQFGMEARVVAMDGRSYAAKELLEDTFTLIQNEASEDYEVHPQVFEWIRLLTKMPDYKAIASDTEPNQTIRRFYRRGGGTLAQYQRARASQLILGGMYESDAIARVQVETAKCHREYLEQFDPFKRLQFLRYNTRQQRRNF